MLGRGRGGSDRLILNCLGLSFRSRSGAVPGRFVLYRFVLGRLVVSRDPAGSYHAITGKLSGFRRCRDRRTPVIDGRQHFMVLTGGVLLA